MNDYTAKIISNTAVSADGKKMVVEVIGAPQVRGGQFAMLKTDRADLVLRRPLGICDADGGTFTFIYQIKGKGTAALADMQSGQSIKVLMPLGNGFDAAGAKSVWLVGGGYGAVPLYLTAKRLTCEKRIYLGFPRRDAVLLYEEFSRISTPVLCTDDGSCGAKGFPTAALEKDLERSRPDIIMCCGPEPLMKAVRDIGARYGVKTQLSLEQRMGCGVGACLVCTCRAGGENKRVCADGPVFDGAEVLL